MIFDLGLGLFRPGFISFIARDDSAIWVAGSSMGVCELVGSAPLAKGVIKLMLLAPRHVYTLPGGPADIEAETAAEYECPDDRTILCACEDVTAKEFLHAIEHGYAEMELLKRYTGLSTGPCQGKSCLCHGARMLAAQAGGDAVRPTRYRPPNEPVSLSDLAGEEKQP